MKLATAALPLLMAGLTSCHGNAFPDHQAGYHEFAYVADGDADTVAVLDLVYLRQDRMLQVGHRPTGLAVNPVRNEVYAVNTGSDSVSVIDTENNRVAATIGVHHTPYFIDVAPDGKRAYVANSASNTVSVIDLDKRREIAVAAAGEGPGMARVAPDNRTLVVSNRIAGSVSVYSITDSDRHPLEFREAFSGCPGATDIAISANSTSEPKSGAKAFVACSGGHQIMDIWLAASADSWRGQQDHSLQHDQMLALLDVGKTPTHLALKPDSGEVFSTNFDSDSISEISTWTNEVSGTYVIGAKPSRAIVSQDNTSLWVTNFGADSTSLYSIDDGRLITGIRTGSRPDAIAFSADEHLLLVADSGASDVAVIRTQSKSGFPQLFTILPAGKHPNDIVVKAFQSK
ncbi:YncE family protein [Granulicella mallensis]|uniref:YVTN family beta-propeller protein n=1 Tax=Granulicella mallensis TaxID=940614 RepID=A0A7W8ECH8_9BACT|nr:YncE family protein [Granulicella mallensis]MBB5066721.1 YVTN family beta-propeller protein [Granulicella mallensis]